MKYLITTLVYLLSLLVIGAGTLFIVLVVAGPHAGLLPTSLEVPVLVLGWAVIMAAPVLLARKVWHRLDEGAKT